MIVHKIISKIKKIWQSITCPKTNSYNRLKDLKIFPGHEGIYCLRDLGYIARITGKIANEISVKIKDIDWLQLLIETFLILNSRVYEDLISDLIKECSKQKKLDIKDIKDEIKDFYSNTLSYNYHCHKNNYRHRAAHGTNYLRVGIIEFGNDILPQPINYEQTEELMYMANIKNFTNMWYKDIKQCSLEITMINNKLINLLNKYS